MVEIVTKLTSRYWNRNKKSLQYLQNLQCYIVCSKDLYPKIWPSLEILRQQKEVFLH